MTFWVVNILNGVSLAMILFLLASGLTLVFGLMRIVNMVHGSFYLLGGYIALSVTQGAAISSWERSSASCWSRRSAWASSACSCPSFTSKNCRRTNDPSGKALKDVDWLIHRHAITILPSIASLKGWHSRLKILRPTERSTQKPGFRAGGRPRLELSGMMRLA